MKKLLHCALLCVLVTSCASNKQRDSIVSQQELMEDTVREDKIIGDALPSWTKHSGIENGQVYAVGKAEFDANKSEVYIEKAALMDGEIKLLTDAPADVRVLTQSALTGAGIDSSEFYQIQTKLQEVVGLTGLRHDEEKITCRKVVRHGEFSSRLMRACWVQVSIPVKELVAAYRRTLALKFGEYKANEFRNLMMDQVDKIQNNPLLKKELSDEPVTEKSNSGSRNVPSGINSPSRDMSSEQNKTNGEQPEVYRKDSTRPDLSRSRTEADIRDDIKRVSAAHKGTGGEEIIQPGLSGTKDLAKQL